MLFVMRSALCLGLVFWAIPPHEGGKPARPEAGNPKNAIASAAGQYCHANPQLCLKIASGIARQGQNLPSGRIAEAARAAIAGHGTTRGDASRSLSTLTPEDRAIEPRRTGHVR